MNERGAHGATGLMMAAMGNQVEVVDSLLSLSHININLPGLQATVFTEFRSSSFRNYFPESVLQFAAYSGNVCRLFFAYFGFSLILKGYNTGQETSVFNEKEKKNTVFWVISCYTEIIQGK